MTNSTSADACSAQERPNGISDRPPYTRCAMEDRGICGLARAADSALVDVPVSGSYYDHYRGVPVFAVNYAVKLAEIHPRTRVVMCTSVASAKQTAFLPRSEALDLLAMDTVSRT